MPKTKTINEASAGVPMLAVTPSKAPVVDGNFEDIKAFLLNWKQRVSSLEMTEDNMEEVRVIKKEAVQYRNSLAKIQKDVKKLYFNDPKSVFDAKMDGLLAVVGDVEDAADKVLAKEEEERVGSVNLVLDSYRTELQERYALDSEHLARVEYPERFYNKTVPQGFPSMDKFWKTSLEQQFQELKKEQDAYAANVRLIETTCKDEPRLNVKHYIERLQRDSVAIIIEAIVDEKQRLKELDAPRPAQTANAVEDADCEVIDDDGEEEDTGEAAKIVLGVTEGLDFMSDFQNRKKTIRVEITYPCDVGDALTEVFARLRKCGITSKPIREEVSF